MQLRQFNSSAFCLIALVVTGCDEASLRLPVNETAQSSVASDLGFSIVRLSEKNINTFGTRDEAPAQTALPRVKAGEYRIGPGDIVSVYVFDHPELAVPAGADEKLSGFLVQSDGTLLYPFIGSVEAEGRTVAQLREEMTDRLTSYFPSPQVEVRVTGYNSQRVVVGGEVANANTQSIQSTPLTLLESINGAGGLTEDADGGAVIVRRNGINYSVDLDAYLTAQLSGNNPVLIGGDVVSVPKKKPLEAYLLGEVQRPAPIDLSDGRVSLTHALTRQGGINEARADARGVFVFREVNGKYVVFQLDMSSPTSLVLGTRFDLRPADVVYVTKAPLQRWNDTISRLLPTVSAATAAKNL